MAIEPLFEMGFPDEEALRDAYSRDLAHGRAFLPEVLEHPLFARCTLTLRHPTLPRSLALTCEIVMVSSSGPLIGTAVQLTDRSAASLKRIQSFVEANESAVDQAVRGRPARAHNLGLQERLRIARSSVLEDRVQLERAYGSAVWEALLRGPHITIPEVARMSRKATLPRPLLDLIADNERWIRNSLVRRALLSNPRLGPESVQKILRALPKRELRLVPEQTAYPQAVRNAARRILQSAT